MTRTTREDRGTALSDFQRATAEHAFRRLYRDRESSRRFLVADETGLGKTHVAQEVIAQTLEHLQQVDHVRRIDIVYVCSNADIASQNIRKLNATGSESPSFATRLTLLIRQPDVLKPAPGGTGKPATFVAFTPATSFQFGWQLGTATERAVLYVLLRDHLGLGGKQATAAERIFQGGVSSRQRFVDWYVAPVRSRPFESSIQRTFLQAFDRSSEPGSLAALIEEVEERETLTDSQRASARRIVGGLRRMLARAAVTALEPDLVILDEFQRFRDLLDVKSGGEAAELAHEFFNQSDARVLLLSATPYKPFTYAEEAEEGAGHYADFLKTLEFLADSDEPVESLQADLDAMRQAALAGEPTAAIRDRVQAQLRKWIARTERPTGDRRATTLDTATSAFRVQSDDFSGFVALRRVAAEVNAPLGVEYWKSAPYFLNFLSGYRVGERVRDWMKDAELRSRLVPLFGGAQRIDRSDVEGFQPLDWANARMRALYGATLKKGWWRLLWMPPSLPYHQPGGPYAAVDSTGITKQLIFSSWVAAPSAIASLLSYEVQRQIFTGAGQHSNTPAARAALAGRLDYRMAEGRPAAMSTLALFWPQPMLAARTDPLDAARDHDEPPTVTASARVGVRPRRISGRCERRHQFNRKRCLALVRAGEGRAGQRACIRAHRAAARRPCRRAAGSFARSRVRGRAGRSPRRARQPHAKGSRGLDAGVGTAVGPGNDQWASRLGSAGEHRVARTQAAEADGRPRDGAGPLARGGDPGVGLAESFRAAQRDAAPRRPVRRPEQRARGRRRLLAQGRAVLHRRRAPGSPR